MSLPHAHVCPVMTMTMTMTMAALVRLITRTPNRKDARLGAGSYAASTPAQDSEDAPRNINDAAKG